MAYYTAINYWVLGGFEGRKPPLQAVQDARDLGLDGVELTFGDALRPDITAGQCGQIVDAARRLGVGLRTLATGHYWGCWLASPDPAERQQAIAFTERYLAVAKLARRRGGAGGARGGGRGLGRLAAGCALSNGVAAGHRVAQVLPGHRGKAWG